MPWVGKERFQRIQQSVQAGQEAHQRALVLEVDLRHERERRERLELEYERLRQDFNELTRITAGRVPPKLAPEFNKDIFKEDNTLPEIFLSPNPDDIELVITEAQELMAQTDGAENPEGRDE